MYKYNPKVLHYLISFECNQKCSKCSHWKFKYYEEKLLDIELFIKNLPLLKLLSEICIVGGEPLISKNKILKILDSVPPNVKTVIVTNGVLLNKNLIRDFSKYNMHFVVSIDTLDRDFWNFVRGSDSFDKVINNVEYARKALNPDKLSIQSVLSEETKSHVSEVANYAKKLGVYHSIQPYITEGFEGSWTPIKLENQNLGKSFEKCYSTGRNLSIMPNGDVFTCFQQSKIEDCEKPLGNLKYETLDRILSSNYTEQVMKKMYICNLSCKVLKCNQIGDCNA
jgi:MoaA/NifB/PqqE/SkfB family radical SAM enzyme